MRGIYKKSLSEAILLALEKAVDGYVRYDDLIHHPSSYAWGSGWDKQLKKPTLSQALKRLRERGLIQEDKVDTNKVIFKLTEAGKDALGVGFFDEKSWDGKWRIVIFDIPEQKRLVRDLFRRNLKKWGFKHLQKSVLVSKQDIFSKLTAYVKELGIERWVVVIESDRLSNHNS
ncbi:MAG: hypothetical protein HYW45_02750 [Candidatus Daviesbacteria bacterium]|nr:MAG: hypothetical protein HYW45_02750 [Candidatus Daviesbacteria bacterium]